MLVNCHTFLVIFYFSRLPWSQIISQCTRSISNIHIFRISRTNNNKCISDGLMHVAAWHQSSPNSGKKCSLARTLTMQKKYLRYPRSKICAPWKNGSKSLKTCYPKAPIMPNFIKIGETTLEKSVTKIFYTIQYFGSPGLGGWVHQPPL